jgi:hypothetical protein
MAASRPWRCSPATCALGLYTARSLSYDGVEYELVEHKLTPDQTRISFAAPAS